MLFTAPNKGLCSGTPAALPQGLSLCIVRPSSALGGTKLDLSKRGPCLTNADILWLGFGLLPLKVVLVDARRHGVC